MKGMTMTLDRPMPLIGLLAALLLTASACSIAPGASSAAPGASGTPAASEACHQITIQASQSSQTIGSLRKQATNIVVGVFGGFGQARWNTPDGHRPSKEEVRDTSTVLLRSVAIDVKGQIRGARTAAEHAVVGGGQLGCDSVMYSDDPALTVGQRYIFFLFPILNSKLEPSDDLLVIAAWPVGKSDVVSTPQEGDMSLADVKKGIEEGTKPIVGPNPSEPWPSGPG
jgi:hypothetical protein